MQTTLTSNGCVIDQDPAKFGHFRESSEYAADGAVLRERLSEDGYVFLRDVLDKHVLLQVQGAIADELNRLDALDPDGDRSAHLFPARAGLSLYKVADNISHTERRALTGQPALQAIFRAIFGEEAKSLDYSWPRIAGPGRSEQPHCDWVFMRRGTPRLYTAWIPLMDLPLSHGPLMILENSHLDNPYTRGYLRMDADELGYFDAMRFKHGTLVHGGNYSRRPNRVRDEFGTRWLSADYRLGDVIIFSTRAVHATLDNRSQGFRTSIDARFQPANDVTDPRFVGPHPTVHSARDINIFQHAHRLTGRQADGLTALRDKWKLQRQSGLLRHFGRHGRGADGRAAGSAT
ncbi:phytanoyl-CoA dioxygenase family protein [Mycobacterium sp. URHB0044]|uniref:phytanoyl-CoA dioxygenase family protein n=1 Tax=Mycobacterium sp. URHB0044 TaxID=1380386 RepID=UPI00049048C4|nr:phytanoyl-CoA dioxygenase family protein [Mycobacterium sp. URHB0044]